MKKLLSVLVVLLFVFGCDSGEDEQTPDDKQVEDVQDKKPPATVQCTKHSTCEWGELCIEKSCQSPWEEPKATAYDFTRMDECATSKTYQQQISLSDNHGSVTLLYFSTTACAACVADVREYEGIVSQLEAKGFVGLGKMITVILPMSASAMANFSDNLKFPVVVDDNEVGIADHYGANKDTVVLVDGAGYLRETWPSLDVRGGATDRGMLTEKLMEMANELL